MCASFCRTCGKPKEGNRSEGNNCRESERAGRMKVPRLGSRLSGTWMGRGGRKGAAARQRGGSGGQLFRGAQGAGWTVVGLLWDCYWTVDAPSSAASSPLPWPPAARQ
eukprot:1514917-Prymnesium_polylepis.1